MASLSVFMLASEHSLVFTDQNAAVFIMYFHRCVFFRYKGVEINIYNHTTV